MDKEISNQKVKYFTCKACGKRVKVGKKGLPASIRGHYQRSHPHRWRRRRTIFSKKI